MCDICNFCLKEVKDESTVRLLDWMIYNIWLKCKILSVAVRHSPRYSFRCRPTYPSMGGAHCLCCYMSRELD
jgi:hypothetical protein